MLTLLFWGWTLVILSQSLLLKHKCWALLILITITPMWPNSYEDLIIQTKLVCTPTPFHVLSRVNMCIAKHCTVKSLEFDWENCQCAADGLVLILIRWTWSEIRYPATISANQNLHAFIFLTQICLIYSSSRVRDWQIFCVRAGEL